MYGSVGAEIEVQRTIKRAELTAFLCLLKGVIGPIKVHVDNKGIIDGLWRGERECIKPKAGNADLWIKIWEELHLWTSKETLVDAEHVKAHRTEKKRKRCHTLGSLSLMAMGKRMGWQKKEQCWTKDPWRRQEQQRSSRKEKRCMQLCST